MNRKSARLRDLPGPAGSSEDRDGASNVDNMQTSRESAENNFQSVISPLDSRHYHELHKCQSQPLPYSLALPAQYKRIVQSNS